MAVFVAPAVVDVLSAAGLFPTPWPRRLRRRRRRWRGTNLTTLARAAVIKTAFAIVGWAVCGAAIAIGFGLMSERGALILHAIVAPIAFAGLRLALILRASPYTDPLTTALLFLAIVVALDVFVVALLIERKQFAHVREPLGNVDAVVADLRLDLGHRRAGRADKTSVKNADQASASGRTAAWRAVEGVHVTRLRNSQPAAARLATPISRHRPILRGE